MRIPFLVITMSLLGLCARGQQTFTIRGQVTQLPDGEVIGLLQDHGTIMTLAHKDTIRNGSFTFSDTCSVPTRYMITGVGDKFPPMTRAIWVSPGSTVRITGKDYLFKTWEIKSPVPLQQEADRYIFASRKAWDAMQRSDMEQEALSVKARQATEEEKKLLRKTRDSLRDVYNEEYAKVQQTNMTLLQKLPVTDSWIEILAGFALDIKLDPKNRYRNQTLELYKRLSPQQLQSRNGVLIKNSLFPPPVVKTGEPMADTVLADASNNMHRLSEYQGKYLLLDFWSVGCGPCIMAMPELRSLSDSLANQLTVISINMDSDKEIWQKISKNENINWVNLNDKYGMGGLAARYGVTGIPHYVIVSPDGKMIDAWTGYEQGIFTKKVGPFLQTTPAGK